MGRPKGFGTRIRWGFRLFCGLTQCRSVLIWESTYVSRPPLPSYGEKV